MRLSNPETLRAVVFDFDGTLADSYAAIAASVNHVRAHHGLPPLPLAEVQRHVGRGPHYLLHHTVGGEDVESDIRLYRAHHPTVMRPLTHLLPGANQALRAARHSGRRVGVCSNKPRAFTVALLADLGVAPLIDTVVGPEDTPQPKPAPDMLLLTLRQLGVAPQQALYVGDMVVDIETARAAGVTVWVVPTGSDALATLEQARPDHLLRDLNELAEWLQAHSSQSP